MVGGNFLYWFNGQLYKNLMRLDASFRPDPTWKPVVVDAVATLAVDREGRLLVAGNSASSEAARIQRFNADGGLDANWQPLVKGQVYKLLPATDGMLFVGGAFSAINDMARNSLARFRADGTLDTDWASQPTWPILQPSNGGGFGRDGIYNILDAGADGVFFTWEDTYMNGGTSGVIRLSRSASGAVLPLPFGVESGGGLLRDPKTGDIYATADAWYLTGGLDRGTALVRMVSPGMTIDPAWTTLAGEYGRQFSSFAYQTDTHVYVCGIYFGSALRRFDKATGREDLSWSGDETYLCGANLVERRDNGNTLFSPDQYGQLSQFSTTASNTPVNVVEYYSRDAKRFFITARSNEITQLDAMSTNFVRTGMTFAAETALVRSFSDTTRAPICRFYAPPSAGGSNTHFYGREADCTLLKRFSTLRYEGYDFRAGLPTSGTCPAALPAPVFRLFNNAVASNNGNHRYVVSTARRAEMLAVGWLDEGVAFCTTSAVDSQPLPQIQ